MGYMGLRDWLSPDDCADMTHNAIDKMIPVLKRGLRESGNEFNPSGCVNVALFNEAFILPAAKQYAKADGYDGKLLTILEDADKRLGKEITEAQKSDASAWDTGRKSGSANKRSHLAAYLRMRKNLRKTLSVMKRESWR
jgi:hypothetical protein